MSATLWPDLPAKQLVRGMRQMLHDAGAGLSEKTGGLVTFTVRPLQSAGNRTFEFTCELLVKEIGYRYPLFNVRTSLSPFPAEIITATGSTSVQDEEQLKSKLGAIFQSDETKNVLINLMSIAIQ